jgi:hypothetical protein
MVCVAFATKRGGDMGIVLRVLAVVYLVLIWLAVALTIAQPGLGIAVPFPYAYSGWQLIFVGILLSVPGLTLFAFGQITDDVRAIRNQRE